MIERKIAFNRKGTITIELSVIFPIFCVIALSFVFYMHGIVLQIGMGVAAREGGREYSLNHNPEWAVARTQEVLNDFMIDRAIIQTRRAGAEMHVVVDRPYSIYVPFVGEKAYDLRRMYIFHAETQED